MSSRKHSLRKSYSNSPIVPLSPLALLPQHQDRNMVKFSKQFEGQLVPEWKEAFVDYWQLKKDLKKIRLLNNNTTTDTHQATSFPHNFLSSITTFGLFGRRRDQGVIQVLFGSLS